MKNAIDTKKAYANVWEENYFTKIINNQRKKESSRKKAEKMLKEFYEKREFQNIWVVIGTHGNACSIIYPNRHILEKKGFEWCCHECIWYSRDIEKPELDIEGLKLLKG